MILIETCYLIDYENVHEEGLVGCDSLKKTDHIVIFFTPQCYENRYEGDIRSWTGFPGYERSARG